MGLDEKHRIVTTCIIHKPRKDFDGTRFLLLQRAPHKRAFPNQWTVPGGGLEPVDYIHDRPNSQGVWYNVLHRTLRREVEEETGCVIGEPRLLVDMTFIRPDTPPTPVLILSYYAPYVSGEVRTDGDSVSWGWYTLQEAKEMDLIAGIFEELEMVVKILNGWDPSQVTYGGK